MGIQINGNTNNINAGIGSLSIEDINELDIVGVATAANFKTGVSNLHNVGLTLSGGQIDVGSNIKIGTAGVITATSFVGSGANLTGLNSDLINDTSPQLGGDLDVNNFDIKNGNQIYEIVINQRHNFKSAGNTIMNINGNGVDFEYGNNTHADNVKSQFGASNDLKIYHSSSNAASYIQNSQGNLFIEAPNSSAVKLRKNGTTETMLVATAGGAVELYHNNALKFDTVTTGIRVHGDEGGTAQLQLLADQGDDNADYWRFVAETNGILNIQDYGSGNWYNNIRLTGHTGGVILFQNNDAKFQTQSDGVRVEDGGKLYLQNDSENAASYITNLESSGESNIIFNTYDGSSSADRWEITKDGHFIPQVNNDMDIGAPSYRVRNIYTNDLNLSNKGSTNSVDNTWGDYTIQEGESDLFLINNRSGKKYKFNLTEVS